MSKTGKRKKILETKYFAFVIGALVFCTFFLISNYTVIMSRLEEQTLDTFFRYRTSRTNEDIQLGVSLEGFKPGISPDILIVGIDLKSLERFGKWPFPRWREADFVSSLARIANQNERENSVFLDIFFVDPDPNPTHDGILVQAIRENGRVFLETVLDEFPPPQAVYDQYYDRQQALHDNYGTIENVEGNWRDLPAYYGIQPPLVPYASASAGYGHANYKEDYDDVYRRQPLIAKTSRLLKTIRFDELDEKYSLDSEMMERLVWTDKYGKKHNIEYPIDKSVLQKLGRELEEKAIKKETDTDGDKQPDDSYFVIEHYRDSIVPSITLALALNYFNKSLDDIDVVIGSHILIKEPQLFDSESGTWEPYSIVTDPAVTDENGGLLEPEKRRGIDEIRIPIDEDGAMLINFMGYPSFAAAGEAQTYPVRSFSGYAVTPPGTGERLPPTKKLENKIVMVGAFTRGMADDQKPTPYGLMYGVEVHANALNTIIMDNFLKNPPLWVEMLILAVSIFLISLLASRFSTLPSLFISLGLILAIFFGASYIFDSYSYVINFPEPSIAIVLTFLIIIAYRAMTEERDKRRIRGMFGTYLSPTVVDQIIDNPPELGGVDKNISVFFSDIRGFTTLSESMPPQELVQLLNRYLTAMTDIILEYEGTLDKYEGDAIMCFWGAPLPQEDHAFRACCAAVRQLEALEKLNLELPPEQQINIGIGINSGIMTVGNMGSTQRMDYTLIGDNVNLGARLEGTNKQYRTNIIISEFTYGLVKDRVIARELDNIRVKGKNKPVLIYELIDII